MTAVRANHPKADLSIIERAYAVAERAHDGQMRKSGDAYITHPLAVTTILAELGMTPPTLAAALLHDTVEDTAYGLDELRTDFGDEIAMLVDGVTKLDKVTYGEAAQAETVRKMVIAMARDIRVLVIKLADRLHNARTWRYVSEESAKRKANETLEIYAPLAHRLGMNTIKWELEDLSFATLYPKVYDEIVRLVAERAPAREEYLAGVRTQVTEDLTGAKIKAVVTGRPKHYYSVYQKMIVRGRDFEEIYDLVAVRVLVDTVRDCYAALGALHSRWNPVPGRFKDYIAMPKFNMYQSLHTTVIGPQGKPVEIQIRTHTMHRRAEYGVAAHWKYKDTAGSGGGARPGEITPQNDMAWLRQLLDWQRETEDPGEFLDSLRFEMGSSEVYVFTPKGSVVALPVGGTPVDFAYAVHTEVGHHCIGARVNGRLVPLESTLENGDVVEVLTSKADGAGPSRDWLQFVKSPRARNKIKQWFSKERREEAIDAGKEAIAKALRKQNLPLQRLMSHESMTAVATDLRYQDIEALYAAVGEGHVSAQHVVGKVVASMGGVEGATEDLAEATVPTRAASRRRPGDPGVVVVGTPDVWVKLAKCCTPVPGRPDHRLRHARRRRLGAPRRLHERRPADGQPRAAHRRRVGAELGQRLPRAAAGRGARPQPPAQRRDARAVRPARQHPVGVGADLTRPGGDLALHLRDGRPGAPRPRHQGRAQDRRRLRRLPRQRRQVDHVAAGRNRLSGQDSHPQCLRPVPLPGTRDATASGNTGHQPMTHSSATPQPDTERARRLRARHRSGRRHDCTRGCSGGAHRRPRSRRVVADCPQDRSKPPDPLRGKPMPSGSTRFVVVGVTGGHAFSRRLSRDAVAWAATTSSRPPTWWRAIRTLLLDLRAAGPTGARHSPPDCATWLGPGTGAVATMQEPGCRTPMVWLDSSTCGGGRGRTTG